MLPHAEVLNAARGQNATVAVLETSVDLQRISDEQYRQYVHALQVSTQNPLPRPGRGRTPKIMTRRPPAGPR